MFYIKAQNMRPMERLLNIFLPDLFIFRAIFLDQQAQCPATFFVRKIEPDGSEQVYALVCRRKLVRNHPRLPDHTQAPPGIFAQAIQLIPLRCAMEIKAIPGLHKTNRYAIPEAVRSHQRKDPIFARFQQSGRVRRIPQPIFSSYFSKHLFLCFSYPVHLTNYKR